VSGSAAFPAALRRLRALAAAALFLLATGCAISQPAVPLRQFIDGDLGSVRSFAAAQASEGPAENLALVLNVQAQCDLLLGRFDGAVGRPAAARPPARSSAARAARPGRAIRTRRR
jgi:hypothetical protein